jgi:hypothetical protein
MEARGIGVCRTWDCKNGGLVLGATPFRGGQMQHACSSSAPKRRRSSAAEVEVDCDACCCLALVAAAF